ncbi:hypothetical protein [Arthrobacter sp. UYEF36]|uniref:hypothetical protein n=1 Tax=Arthrobacter sp. UYEF36 TaxID=1756366 RepID=UPI003391FA57
MSAKYGQLGDYSEILNPENLAQFLATQNWTCQIDRPTGQLWTRGPAGSDRPVSVLLPKDRSFADFDRRLHDALDTLTTTYDWHVATLAEQISMVHADLFFVRVDQSMTDGTIPLRQASRLLENIDQLIRSAAIATHNPHHSGAGRAPRVVNDFLNEDVRMGHTKRGSFIITVAAKLDTPQRRERLKPNVSREMSEVDQVGSFTRQVMTTLSKTLDATRRHVERKGDFVELESAIQTGLRLPMVEALRGMGKAEGLKSLVMSFEWAASEPVKEVLPERIQLGRHELDELSAVEQKLRRQIVPTLETLVGPVVELKRSEERPGSDQEGEVVVRADVEGRDRRITVPLFGRQYDWAIRAHRARLPLTVTGVLAKEGRSWRLEDASADTEILELYFRDRSDK